MPVTFYNDSYIPFKNQNVSVSLRSTSYWMCLWYNFLQRRVWSMVLAWTQGCNMKIPDRGLRLVSQLPKGLSVASNDDCWEDAANQTVPALLPFLIGKSSDFRFYQDSFSRANLTTRLINQVIENMMGRERRKMGDKGHIKINL